MRVSVSEPYMLFGSSYRVVHSSLLWISVVQVPIGKFTDAFAELSRDLESFLLSSHSLILAGSCWGPVWMCRLMRSRQVGFQHEGLWSRSACYPGLGDISRSFTDRKPVL